MMSFGFSLGGIANPRLKYEAFLQKYFSSNLVGYYPLGDTASPAVDLTSNAFNSVAVGTGVAFANAASIPNSLKTSVALNGTAAQTYIQLESSPGSRFRVTTFTLNIWAKREGTGNASASGTGTGGIIAEPLMMKGGAESETSGINMNWGFGLEAMGSNFYISADFEKDNTGNLTDKPTGRNARMCDCSVASNVFTFRSTTQAAGTAVPHTFNNGDRVRFGGTAITGVTAGTWYFIVSTNQGAGTFQISATSGGAAITGLGTVAAGGGAWFNHAIATVVLGSADTGWHMYSCTWDGTNLKTYMDGVLAENEVPTMTPPENISTQLAALFAYVTSAAARTGSFNGKGQHASIWSAALTAQNLLDLYNNGIVAAPPATPAPSASMVSTTPNLPGATIVVQLTDGTVGIDDASVVTGSVVLKKDGVTLTPVTDYTFAYNSGTDQITLTAVLNGGVFPVGVYTVILN